jgi:sirohydrochlorin cobaltochelatase
MTQGLILFAHGAREPRWAEPFERLLARVRAQAQGVDARLAFLELMQPDLPATVAELVELGTDSIRIVPVFLGEGGHVRRDLPALVGKLQQDFPDVAITCVAPAGEDPGVQEALAGYCLEGLGTPQEMGRHG